MLKKVALTLCVVAGGNSFCANLADLHKEEGENCTICHQSTPSAGAEVERAVCLQCHPRSLIESKYEVMGNRNPHKNHLGELECTLCHKGHAASQSYCLQCHSNIKHEM